MAETEATEAEGENGGGNDGCFRTEFTRIFGNDNDCTGPDPMINRLSRAGRKSVAEDMDSD